MRKTVSLLVLSAAVPLGMALGCQAVLGIEVLEESPAETSSDGGADAASEAMPDTSGSSDVSAETAADVEVVDAASETVPPSDATTEGGSCDPECPTLGLARPPCKPAVADSPSLTEPLLFAVRTMMTGMNPDHPDDWLDLGLDLDCLFTDEQGQPPSCIPAPDAGSKQNGKDGHQGRDNSFGSNIGAKVREMTKVLGKNYEDSLNKGLEVGFRGILLEVGDYNGEADDPNVWVTVLSAGGTVDDGGNYVKPGWMGKDVWTVESSNFQAGSFEPLFKSTQAYVSGRVLVAKMPSGLPLTVSGEAAGLKWTLDQTTVLFKMDPQHTYLTDGVIAGVWPAALAADSIASVLASIGTCPDDPGSKLIEPLIADSLDIRDKAIAQPQLDCQAISVGLGFVGMVARRGPIIDPAPAKPDPCAKDAGTDSP